MIESGVYFDNIHSFHNLNLILSAVEIAPAAPKVSFVEIPGGDGSIDLTEALGEVKFMDRTHKFVLSMNPSGDLSDAAWEAKKTEVSNYLNGRACKITLDKDAAYYWIGRCSVDSYSSTKRLRQIVVTATVRPYKYKQEKTIKAFTYNAAVTNELINLTNSRKSVCPSITCTEDNTEITFNGNTYKLNAGTHKLLDILLTFGDNHMTISGSGTVTFTYQEGDL